MSRAEVIKHNENTPRNGWNVNPSLDPTQQRELIKLLEEYSEIFASNPKKPTTTHLMQHVIQTGDSLPVKSKNFVFHLKQNKRSIRESVKCYRME